jgi:hypothetical protein
MLNFNVSFVDPFSNDCDLSFSYFDFGSNLLFLRALSCKGDMTTGH